MKYFKLMASNVDTQAMLDEINENSEIWGSSTGRQEKIAVQRESASIPLRGLVKSKIGNRKRRDVHESRFTTASKQFPVIVDFLHNIAFEYSTELGRAKIVNLKSGCRVYPHCDRGEYYLARNRYHLILQSSHGSLLTCADEEVRMHERELWWFDNDQEHSAYNDSNEDRIHLIFDMLADSKASANTAAQVSR